MYQQKQNVLMKKFFWWVVRYGLSEKVKKVKKVKQSTFKYGKKEVKHVNQKKTFSWVKAEVHINDKFENINDNDAKKEVKLPGYYVN